jgi:D-tyrosyl-tRNA(Tyr) deacylase
LLVGIGKTDGPGNLAAMAQKIFKLRLFAEPGGSKFTHSIAETTSAVIAVPQFTLFADTSKGRRPDFTGAMEPMQAKALFEEFCLELSKAGIKEVQRGVFGAHMRVSLENDGPVTIILDN